MSIMSTALETACQDILEAVPPFFPDQVPREPVVLVDDPVVLESLDVMNRENNAQLASDVAQKLMYLASTGLYDRGGIEHGTGKSAPSFMLRPGDTSSKDSSINQLLSTLPYVSQIPAWPIAMDSYGNITSWMPNPFPYSQFAVKMDDFESVDNVSPCQKSYIVTLDPCQTKKAGITNEQYSTCISYWGDMFTKPSANGHCYSSATVTNPVTGVVVVMKPTSAQRTECLNAGGDADPNYSPDYDPVPVENGDDEEIVTPDDDDNKDMDDDGADDDKNKEDEEVIPPDDGNDDEDVVTPPDDNNDTEDQGDENEDIVPPDDDKDTNTSGLTSAQKTAIIVSAGIVGLIALGTVVGLLAWKAGGRKRKAGSPASSAPPQ